MATLELTDTHTHLDAEQFNEDREAVIERARAAGISRFVTIGAGSEFTSAQNAIALAERYPFIWATAGIHPHDATTPLDEERLKRLASHPRVVAIGETGLDFFRDLAPRDLQEQWFRAQIKLALAIKKPLVIHSREAGKECFSILEEMGAAAVGGVFHCYAEDEAFAERLTHINFKISVPGSVTFKKAEKLRAVVKSVPLEKIMLETDAPYLAPEPHRGKRCESSFMVETAKMIAKLKGLSLEELAQKTTETAIKFFGLS